VDAGENACDLLLRAILWYKSGQRILAP
jgi:hypothetical protein